MRYLAHENIPHGWEVTDTQAVPPRTFAVGLTQPQAIAVTRELNEAHEKVETLRAAARGMENELAFFAKVRGGDGALAEVRAKLQDALEQTRGTP
jgi:hypothetical protein